MLTLRKIFQYIGRLPKMDRPLKTTIALILQKSGLSRLIIINRDLYRIRFFPHSAIARSTWIHPEIRSREEQIIGGYLHEGDTIIDVGANIGTVTLMAANKVGPKGSVVAIEPHPRTFGYLSSNCALNRFSNVILLNCAVGDITGEVHMSDKTSDDQNRVDRASQLIVRLTTLDMLLAETGIRHIDVLKVDVEGYEKQVLLGASQMLAITQCVFIETIDSNLNAFNTSSAEIADILVKSGFELFRINTHTKDLVGLRNVEDFKVRAPSFKIWPIEVDHLQSGPHA